MLKIIQLCDRDFLIDLVRFKLRMREVLLFVAVDKKQVAKNKNNEK